MKNAVVDNASSGGIDTLSVIYDQHAASLYRLLLALLGNSEDAEDALQEIFVKLATKPLSHVQDLRPYLFKIARNSAINMLRRRQRENCLMESCIDENIPTDAHKFDAANQDWQKMLARLPLEQREIIALKIWEEMTFAEIATVVKAPANTVASRYRYGIERLRRWYEEEEADER